MTVRIKGRLNRTLTLSFREGGVVRADCLCFLASASSIIATGMRKRISSPWNAGRVSGLGSQAPELFPIGITVRRSRMRWCILTITPFTIPLLPAIQV